MIGQTVAHYLILEMIDAGGMGVVYLAKDLELNRLVALKVLPPEVANDAERVRRFKQEAQAASALRHPNIVTVYEVGRHGDLHFMASEYIEGENLQWRLEREPLTLGRAVEVAAQVADALAAAHAAGITHRDIKPANIMLDKDGRVRVIDFGLAKLSEKRLPVVGPEDPTWIAHTAPGVLMGTVAYVSPELLEEREGDERADVWSLGVCLYEMLARRPPFLKETLYGTAASILRDEPAPLGEGVPEGLREVVRKALRKNREERYQTMGEFRSDLLRAGLALGSAGAASRPRTPRLGALFRFAPAAPRRRRLGAGLAVLLAAAVMVAWYPRFQSRRHVSAGREYLSQRTADSLDRARERCERALTYRPNYAPAYVCLANVYALMEEYKGIRTKESLPVAEAHVRKALQLDGELAEAHTSLGFILMKMWRWPEAEAAFKRSIELDRFHPGARHWYCMFLRNVGRHEEAQTQIKIARDLDPSDKIIRVNVVISYLINSETDMAVEEGKQLVNMAPKFWGGRIWLGWARLEQESQSKNDAISDLGAGVSHSQRSHTLLANFGYGKAYVGDVQAAEDIIRELEELYGRGLATGQDLAKVYAGLGRNDEAFEWLERDFAVRSGDLPQVGWHPAFKNLRRDPRFPGLMRRMGLQPRADVVRPPLAEGPPPAPAQWRAKPATAP